MDWNLPELRDGHRADEALLERRARAAKANAGDAPEIELGTVRCLRIEPAATPACGDMLYIHGGGYRLGTPAAYVAYAQALADQSGRRLILPYYPLAPEQPFPAALHAIVAVYRALPDPAATIVAGDSAGGGLAAALCILAARAGQRPAGAILVSPMLDLRAGRDSYDRNAARDPLFSRQAVHDVAALYLQGHAPDDPLVSAIHADPNDFPPTLVLAGGAEVLLDEALDFVRKLALADRRVTMHVEPGMGHVWPLMAAGSPHASEAIAAMAAFAKAQRSDASEGSA